MLEEYYKGDEKWDLFVSYYSDNWKECENKDLILSCLLGNEDIAKVIYGIEGSVEDTLVYINYNIPALEGLTPIECLKEQSLIKRLKTMLMRMPR